LGWADGLKMGVYIKQMLSGFYWLILGEIAVTAYYIRGYVKFLVFWRVKKTSKNVPETCQNVPQASRNVPQTSKNVPETFRKNRENSVGWADEC
jgi:hypothetical protein